MKRGGVSATPPNMPLIIKIRKGRGNIIHRFPSSPYSGDVNPDRRGHDSGGKFKRRKRIRSVYGDLGNEIGGMKRLRKYFRPDKIGCSHREGWLENNLNSNLMSQDIYFVNEVPIIKLFNSSATYSFIFINHVKQLRLPIDYLSFDLVPSPLSDGLVVASKLYINCNFVIKDKTFFINLICLFLFEFELRNQPRSNKKSQYHIRLEEKRKLHSEYTTRIFSLVYIFLGSVSTLANVRDVTHVLTVLRPAILVPHHLLPHLVKTQTQAMTISRDHIIENTINTFKR
ncbi:hypothetical protein Lal_00015564 [Lupinus albus]|nr:hypothetical protein Lal_00015564 [Lupinus albus]